MRRVQGMAATIIVVLVTLAAAVPVAADPPTGRVQDITEGGSSGGAIYAKAGAFPGAPPGRSCGYQPVWPERSGASTMVDIVQALTGSFFNPFGALSALFDALLLPPDAQIRVISDTEAIELEEQGALAGEDPRIIRTFDIDGEGEYIEIVEGLDSFWDGLILAFVGPHPLGTHIEDSRLSQDPLLLSEEEQEAEFMERNDFYPMVQRGMNAAGEQMWWDPFYLSPARAAESGCAPGVVYSPRNPDPRVLLPDVIDLVTRQLPPVQPVVLPYDQENGWAYVQVPTNCGVASSSQADKVAHAAVEYIDPATGNSVYIWSEVHAVPTGLVFDPGDGSEAIICRVSDMAYEVDNPGPCSYVYLDASSIASGARFRARVSVLWSGIYRDSTGAVNVVDIPPTTSTFDIAVAEARPSS